MSGREQKIRELAYFIWESEGRLEGRAEYHWEVASAMLDDQALQDGSAPNGTDPRVDAAAKTSTSENGSAPENPSTQDAHLVSQGG